MSEEKANYLSSTETLVRKLGEPFPAEAIKSRQGGGNTRLSYVEAHTVIRRLNAATGGRWDFQVVREEQTGDLLKATCRLTIPGLGSREHVGVQKVSDRGGEDLHKGAISDALKKCATLFGVGLELYGRDYENDEDAVGDGVAHKHDGGSGSDRHQQPARPAPDRPAAPQPAPAANDDGKQPPPVRTDEQLLAIIRNDNRDPDVRRKALHAYYDRATVVMQLNQRVNAVRDSGLPESDLKAAYNHHHDRLTRTQAPDSIAG